MTALGWAVTLLLVAPAVAVAAHAWLARHTAPDGVPSRPQWWPAFVGVCGPVALLAGAAWLAWEADPARGRMAPTCVAATIIAATAAGGPVATGVLLLADARTRRRLAPSPIVTPPNVAGPAPARGPGDPDVLRGGAWIGVMERLAVLGSLLVGSVEGVAIVLAVKGLGRYPDLRGPGAAERFIIGTFASVLWACGCAGVGLLLLPK